MGLVSIFASLPRALADLVWPPHSLLSNEAVSTPGTITPLEWKSVQFLTEPVCYVCGTPLPDSFGLETVCPACLIHRPAFTSARAAFVYDDTSRSLVLALKRAARADGLPVYAAWMARACVGLRQADVILPVPLHWTRLVARGFNQSAWLAAALARASQRPWAPGILSRRKRTPSQAGLSGKGRHRNMKGAFTVQKRSRRQVHGKTIVLVDDVFTTGATVEACARALFRAGASEVHVVTLARVVRPVRPDAREIPSSLPESGQSRHMTGI